MSESELKPGDLVELRFFGGIIVAPIYAIDSGSIAFKDKRYPNALSLFPRHEVGRPSPEALAAWKNRTGKGV